METITKREFWLGMMIISLSMIVVNFIYPITNNTTIKVEIKELIICSTDEEGVVECVN